MHNITLQSGRAARITPMRYATWLELEDARDAALADMDEAQKNNDTVAANLRAQKLLRERADRLLSECVEGYDALKAELTLPEARELAKRVEILSTADPAFENENLTAAGDGPATVPA